MPLRDDADFEFAGEVGFFVAIHETGAGQGLESAVVAAGKAASVDVTYAHEGREGDAMSLEQTLPRL
jgi:hypothetical protein